MLTYEKHRPAFATVDERRKFLSNRDHDVAPGTMARHVLGTNLGIWGDAQGLMVDAASIMRMELADHARRKNLPQVKKLSAEMIMKNALFKKAYSALVAVNRREIDNFAKSQFKERSTAMTEDAERYLDPSFTAYLYESLIK